MASSICLFSAAASDVGLIRHNNEDAAYAGRRLFAIADGMGGHAAGEVASAAVIDALRPYDTMPAPDDPLEALGRAVIDANREVARRAAEDPARRGMGTTLTAMLFSGDYAALANVGDSRAFRLRGGQVHRITEDHTIGNLVSDAGFLAPVLARYLDGRPDRSADLGLRDLRAGDRFLLCSDGLSPVIDVDAIRDALMSANEPADAVSALIALAEEAGAPDNLTMIVIDVRTGTRQESIEPVTLGSAAIGVAAS